MKVAGLKVELVTEVAKELVWDNIIPSEAGQDFLFGKQNRKLHRLRDKLDFVITDSPILLPIIYRPKEYPRSFDTFVLDMFDTYNNINFLLKRDLDQGFDEIGRVHNKEDSLFIQNRITNLLEFHHIPYTEIELDNNINLNENKVNEVFKYVTEKGNN